MTNVQLTISSLRSISIEVLNNNLVVKTPTQPAEIVFSTLGIQGAPGDGVTGNIDLGTFN